MVYFSSKGTAAPESAKADFQSAGQARVGNSRAATEEQLERVARERDEVANRPRVGFGVSNVPVEHAGTELVEDLKSLGRWLSSPFR